MQNKYQVLTEGSGSRMVPVSNGLENRGNEPRLVPAPKPAPAPPKQK